MTASLIALALALYLVGWGSLAVTVALERKTARRWRREASWQRARADWWTATALHFCQLNDRKAPDASQP